MQKTPLGLTRLAPGEGLSTDNFSFQDLNPKIIDSLLQYAAFRHRHDGHAALASPLESPTVAVATVGGAIPADTTIYVGYTLTDADGGETPLNPDPVTITTQGGLATPEYGPTLTVLHNAGTLLSGNYAYAVTITDGLGGETALGPPTVVTVPTGNANTRIVIGDLAALITDSGGTGYRLWRRVNGGAWGLVADGALAEINDDGSLCADCANVSPPIRTGRTRATNVLKVTAPATPPNDKAASFSIYATVDGTFGNPSLLGTYPIADLGAQKTYTSLDFLDGAPPEASLTMPGAAKINADTEIINLRVKAPVADATALPTTGNRDGDLRVTINDHHLRVWDATLAAWGDLATGGAPSSGGHIVQDEGVTLPQQATLNFVGDGVTVTDSGGKTVVTIAGVAPGGGGAGAGGPLAMTYIPTEEVVASNVLTAMPTPDTITFTLAQEGLVALMFCAEGTTGGGSETWADLYHNGVLAKNERGQSMIVKFSNGLWTTIGFGAPEDTNPTGTYSSANGVRLVNYNYDGALGHDAPGGLFYQWLPAGVHTYEVRWSRTSATGNKVRNRRFAAYGVGGGGGAAPAPAPGGTGTLNWAGVYDNTHNYLLHDVVRTADGAVWVAIADPALGAVPTDAPPWQLVVAAPVAGGPAAFSRETVAINAVGNQDVVMPRGYRLLKAKMTAAGRLRLYTRADKRAADAARTADILPTGADHGVILDAQLDANVAVTLTPAIEGWNDDTPAADTGYVTIDAAAGTTTTLTVVRTEV